MKWDLSKALRLRAQTLQGKNKMGKIVLACRDEVKRKNWGRTKRSERAVFQGRRPDGVMFGPKCSRRTYPETHRFLARPKSQYRLADASM